MNTQKQEAERMKEIYQSSVKEVLGQMGSREEGLTIKEVEKSREKCGWNELAEGKKKSVLQIFLEQYKDFLVIILIASAIISGILGDAESAAVIVIVITMNAILGTVQTVKAEQSLQSLKKLSGPEAKVLRNGTVTPIPARELVVGDVILLEAGDYVPADGRLIENASLKIDESALTGESLAVEKSLDEIEEEVPLGDRNNMLFSGSFVTYGRGRAVVTSVGMQTEVGKIAGLLKSTSEKQTPLQVNLEEFGKKLSVLILVFCGILFGISVFRGENIGSAFMFAVALAVAAIPEALSSIVTIVLSFGTQKMAKEHAIIRKLQAVEGLGSVSVICSDKTGTLTQNQMRVHEAAFDYSPESGVENIIFESIAANSTAHLDKAAGSVKVLGNPTEGALLLWLADRGVDYAALRRHAEVIEQLTFSTERKYMATVVQSPLLNHRVLYVKGAPEYVMNFCSDRVTSSGNVPMTDSRPMLEEKLLQYQNQAMRTLGFAYALVEPDEVCFIAGHLAPHIKLTFLGITAIADPVRKEVPAAVSDCLNAGIKVKIVTGDTPATAREIARQISLWTPEDGDRNIITGPEFAALDDKTLLERIPDLKVIARARPMDKERLVRLLQSQDEVVAVTGDGTNDAPALNAAQVGLSMGDGTSVAKEASDITIIDNSFGSITKAVLWGRSLYRNIQKFILFQMTINVAACLIVLIGAFLGTESPLTVTQMLWVNLIMDTFAALALASLPPDERVMRDKPRHLNDNIVTRSMAGGIIGTGIAFVLLLFGLLQYFKHVDITSLAQFDLSLFFTHFFNFAPVPGGLTRYELTLFFSIFVFLQFWNMFNAKAFGNVQSAFDRLASCKGFLWVTLIILAGQILIVSLGGALFSVTPLQPMDWVYIFVATSSVLWVGEIYRLIRRWIA